MSGFYRSFDDWELGLVKDALAHAGINDIQTNAAALHNVPPAILYHVLSNLRILRDPTILGLIRSRPSLSTWPKDVPPPGLLVLLFDESQEVRQWARSLISLCTEVPIAEEHFVSGHELAMQTVFYLLTNTRREALTANRSMPAVLAVEKTSELLQAMSFVSDPRELWIGYTQVLRLAPNQVLLKSFSGVDCRRIVVEHLHDVGPRKFLLFLFQLQAV